MKHYSHIGVRKVSLSHHIPIERAYSSGMGTIIRIIVGAVVLVLLSGCARHEPPQYLPWNEQLARVHALAERQVPGSVLYSCISGFINPANVPVTLASDQSMTISCHFIDAEGSITLFVYDDLQLEHTMDTRYGELWITPFSAAELIPLEEAQDAIRIGPREAWVAAQPYGQEMVDAGYTLQQAGVRLFIDARVQAAFGLPAAWSVLYTDVSDVRRRVWVSALDGTILAETDGALFPEP